MSLTTRWGLCTLGLGRFTSSPHIISYLFSPNSISTPIFGKCSMEYISEEVMSGRADVGNPSVYLLGFGFWMF